MKLETIDSAKYDKAVEQLEQMAQNVRLQPDRRCDALYWDLLAVHHRRAQRAREEGKPLVIYTESIPQEIFYAMDMVPLCIRMPGLLLPMVMGFEPVFNAAKAFGIATEVCSGQRLVAGVTILGWFPRPDVFIWSNQICDNSAKAYSLLPALYDCPSFFIDRGYRYNERAVEFFTRELEDLVHFLEKSIGRKMDWDRLTEVMRYSRRSMELIREIIELRKAAPSPVYNRYPFEMFAVDIMMAGTSEGVTFYETMRDEVKGRVERGEGCTSEEKYRLMSLYMPPVYSFELLDWMEREHGAAMAAEPSYWHWGEMEIDPAKPLESLSRKSFCRPIDNMHGPLEDLLLPDAIDDAIDFRAEGAVYFAHTGCRQSATCSRVIKDALWEKAGIPTLILDVDIFDSTYVSEDQLKEKLEGFFEMLDDSK